MANCPILLICVVYCALLCPICVPVDISAVFNAIISSFRENLQLRYRSSSERWADHIKTAWAVDPRIALALVARFPGAVSLKAEVFSMVQVCLFS